MQFRTALVVCPPDKTPNALIPFEGVVCPSWSEAQREWVTACATRLGEMQPDEDEDALCALAAEMWVDVGGFDPVIAAEMEHESRGWPE